MDETRQPTRREGTLARRQEILRAALECFIERGFDATSLRQIAARARLTHVGLLHHYESKEALVAALLQYRDEQDEDFAKQLTASEDGRAPALFSLLAHHRASPGEMRFWGELCAAASRPGHPSQVYFAARYDSIRTRMKDVFEGRAQAGDLREGVQPELISMLLPAVLDGLQAQWLLDHNLPMDQAVDHFLALLLRHGATLGDENYTEQIDRSVRSKENAEKSLAVGRRQHILSAAVQLFTSKGFDGTSISEVAAAAGCSKASVLYHFATKDELLRAALEPLNVAFNGLFATSETFSPGTRSKGGVPALIEFCVRHRGSMALLAVLPPGARGKSPLSTWANGSVVELLVGKPRPGTAEFAAAAIPAFCVQSLPQSDQQLRENLRVALNALFVNE